MENGGLSKTSDSLMKQSSLNILWFLIHIPCWPQFQRIWNGYILDLKDAFFCIPLHADSQFLFAFEDLSDQSTQLTRIVLQIVPLFGRALPQDLCQFEHPQTPSYTVYW